MVGVLAMNLLVIWTHHFENPFIFGVWQLEQVSYYDFQPNWGWKKSKMGFAIMMMSFEEFLKYMSHSLDYMLFILQMHKHFLYPPPRTFNVFPVDPSKVHLSSQLTN